MRGEPSISEVIGRMIMVGIRGASLVDPQTCIDLDACRATHVGGVILFDVDMPTYSAHLTQGIPKPTAKERATRNILSYRQLQELIRDLRTELGPSLLVSVDQEGGSVSRLARLLAQNDVAGHTPPSLLPHLAVAAPIRDMLHLAATLGFNVNFAPCVDVAVNPDNPIVVTNGRCFSDDPKVVINSAQEWIKLSDALGVAPCIKHFPGHGSSAGDTHEGFVDITHTFRPDLELEPYRALVADPWTPLAMVMTGHLFDANVDPNHPASLSRIHSTQVLRKQLGFKGVIVTDSLDMGAITKRYSMEDACVLAVNAGADILLDANNAPGLSRPCPAPAMHDAILHALSRGRIDGGEGRLRQSCLRIENMLAGIRRQA